MRPLPYPAAQELVGSGSRSPISPKRPSLGPTSSISNPKTAPFLNRCHSPLELQPHRRRPCRTHPGNGRFHFRFLSSRRSTES
jgi:hypothetical protein